eukprot:CAMPEP_0197694534 /NCGR_PEP_ID=MMETSP1338-20131121/113962_1 /TAXON_ID=43686 ORGANISM="Pelagodinium beii, Strain RCC1491" /NCGR_SAMPLE_ID=MMETSP1338 /ASSEMBLY_ACC=CAM_ASM_000754 /LENGTH=51 /DNA_ID=CAMNT_0043277385 /DNA_START=105 /DNA_END=257 /DNA_ORIENTATION=+
MKSSIEWTTEKDMKIQGSSQMLGTIPSTTMTLCASTTRDITPKTRRHQGIT